MHDQDATWPFIIAVLLIFGGFGAVILFYTDQITEWYISILRSRWNKIGLRVFGFLILTFSVIVTAALLFSKL